MFRLSWILLALAILVSVPALGANDPCFDIVCDEGTCTFDPSCATATPFIWKVQWSFGDGTGTGLTGLQAQVHTFPTTSCGFEVTLTVFPWSDEIESITCAVEPRSCPIGPAIPGTIGRCTASGLS